MLLVNEKITLKYFYCSRTFHLKKVQNLTNGSKTRALILILFIVGSFTPFFFVCVGRCGKFLTFPKLFKFCFTIGFLKLHFRFYKLFRKNLKFPNLPKNIECFTIFYGYFSFEEMPKTSISISPKISE
jgi:hypothetical protein